MCEIRTNRLGVMRTISISIETVQWKALRRTSEDMKNNNNNKTKTKLKRKKKKWEINEEKERRKKKQTEP